MTEIERIINEGIVTHEFLHPETICDYYVDEKRKKVWCIGIDLLVKLDQICRKHSLQYSIAFGSLLGKIRHDGFIPWDDDIDVVMPRKDYEELKLLKSEFEEPYFLQYPGDDNYLFSFAKLRNSNTTSISKPFRYESFNQGQFLDIFPLDNYCETNIEENINRIKCLIAECSALMRRGNPHPDEIDIQKMKQFPLLREGKTIIKELEGVLTQFNNHTSAFYTAWCCVMYDHKRMTFDKSIFDDLIETDFYNHKVFIPRKYDEALKITYGDYMQFPPIDKRGTWHSNSYFEPDIPYQESLEVLRNQDGK
jgi:lipopolysaccharide cholinephosphotransferase